MIESQRAAILGHVAHMVGDAESIAVGLARQAEAGDLGRAIRLEQDEIIVLRGGAPIAIDRLHWYANARS